MKHVSCRALGVLLKAAKRRGIDDALLTEGTIYDGAYLRNPKNRIEWTAFVRVLRNATKAWSLTELSDMNEAFMRSPFFAYVGVIAQLLFTTRTLFDWICKRQVGGGAQLFSDCVQASFEHVGDEVTIIRLEIGAAYEPSPEFFWMTRGAFVALPRMVRSGDAQVDMTIDGRVATYHCRYRNRRGNVGTLMRWVAMPFTAHAAARELKRTNEELQSRYYELANANAQVEQQATQLRIAHRVNDLVQQDIDVDAMLRTITRVLVEEAGFRWARIEVTADVASEAPTAEYGTLAHDGQLSCEIEAREGERVGMLHVLPELGAERLEREELLEFIRPALGIALQNAIYRAGLEHLVDVRTTELREARDQLAGTVDELKEAQSARQRFFGNISHEIRTPLTIITLAAGDIEARAGDKLDARAKAGLGTVTDSAKKLLRLVDELLLLAAGQENKLVAKPEPTDLAMLVTNIYNAWLPAAEAAGLTLHKRVADKIVSLVDPIALERVITNLVSNAVKYTPRGGTVEVELVDEPSGTRLSVLDDGKGIDADLAPRLFQRFERASANDRKISGTGLGLALAKQLVEAHGGTIAHVPRPTGGTEMRVILPPELVRRATGMVPVLRLVDAAKPAPIATLSEVTPAGLSQGTIVVAEDDVRLAEMVARLLGDEYTVHVGNDGLAALELVKKHQPQLLITDVDMPNMDGIELARRFRETAQDRMAPVIILSAMMDLGTRVAGLEAGAVDYVTKPFDPAELKARVRAQFRMRDMAVRLHRAEQLSSLGVLTSGLAHELRNPANGVVNAVPPLVALLPDELKDPEHPVAQLLEVVQTCASQISVLSKQLLGFRHAETTLDVRPISMRDLVKRAMNVCSAATKEVEVRVDVPSTVVQVAPPLMTQVLTNLIENAAHAAGSGGWIQITGRIEAGRAVLEVTDSGPGVPVELRDKIFEPFFTTKPQGVGTGLGLPLSRDIVLRHGGTMAIRDRAGKHAFVIDLPHDAGLDAAATAV